MTNNGLYPSANNKNNPADENSSQQWRWQRPKITQFKPIRLNITNCEGNIQD